MIKKLRPLTALIAVLMVSSLVLVPSLAYAGTIDPGLELHWNLDEGTGSVANDDSGHNNTGTLYNNPSYVPGHDGLGVSLDGVDQYIQNDTPLSSLGTVDQPYALSTWVKVPQGVTAGNIFHISSNADGSGWCIPFLRLENGFFTATGWDQNGAVSAADTTPVVADQWYQVLTSWDPANGLRLFVNGNLVASTPQTDYAASGGPMYASLGLGSGACSDDQGFLNGIVDDARIYARALTPSDIQSISTEGDPATITTTSPTVSAVATSSSNSTPSVAVSVPETGFGRPASLHRPPILAITLTMLGTLTLGHALRSYRKQQ